MSIYNQTTADELNDTLTSISNQTLLPSELVVVFDGPVSPMIRQEINNFSSLLPTTIVSFSHNRGLGPALRDGLLKCTQQFVARIDSDDRSIPDRFAIQNDFINMNPTVSVLGGALKELHQIANSRTSAIRRCPILNKNEPLSIRWRNPLNHPTVIFNKTHILEVGNYQSMPYFEDYHLWARLILHGYWITSLAEVLVETDVKPDYYRRRGGYRYLTHEKHFAQEMKAVGYFTSSDYLVFLLSRVGIRLLPNSARSYIYRKMLR